MSARVFMQTSTELGLHSEGRSGDGGSKVTSPCRWGHTEPVSDKKARLSEGNAAAYRVGLHLDNLNEDSDRPFGSDRIFRTRTSGLDAPNRFEEHNCLHAGAGAFGDRPALHQ